MKLAERMQMQNEWIVEPSNLELEDIHGGSKKSIAKSFLDTVEKFNPYHAADGKFTTAGGAASFTYRTKNPKMQGAVNMAVEREKERTAEPKAIVVETPDGLRMSYRDKGNGFITEIDGVEPKNTNGLTISDIKARAEKNGYKVTTYNEDELKEHDDKRKADRTKIDGFLDQYSAKDRSNTYRAPKPWYKGH